MSSTTIHPDFGQHWQDALANKTKPVVAVVGDSIAKKFNASSIATSWVGRLRTELQGLHGDGGSGFVGMSDAGYASSAQTFLSGFYSQYPSDDRVALTGSWASAVYASRGPGLTLGSTSTVGSTATFRVRGSTICVYFLGLAAASSSKFSVTVDGGVAKTYTVGSRGSDSTVRQQVATGLSTGWHTVVITLLAGGLNLSGVSGENDTGLVLNNFSRGGASTDVAIGGNTEDWCGGVNYPCDLLIYALGVNDIVVANNVGTMAVDTSARARAFISAVREGTPNNHGAVDVVIVGNHIGLRDGKQVFHHVVARYRELALTYQGAFVDMWGTYGNNYYRAKDAGYWGDVSTIGIQGAETLHPGDTGHNLIYQNVRAVVIGS